MWWGRAAYFLSDAIASVRWAFIAFHPPDVLTQTIATYACELLGLSPPDFPALASLLMGRSV